MKPNITNIKKVIDGELALEDLNIEIYYKYIPTHIANNAITGAVSNSIVRYEDEVRVLVVDAQVLFDTLLLAGCTNISTTTIHSEGKDDPFTKVVDLYESALSAGIIDKMRKELRNYDEIKELLYMEAKQTVYLENQKFVQFPTAINSQMMTKEIKEITEKLLELETSIYKE